MASIPGARFDITGTTGSSSALTPKSGWKAYVFPRGAYASADSTGTDITVDSSDTANRFAINNWVQVGLSTANIRRVTLVGAASIRVNSAVTVAENDRVYLIGNTQPTVSGGSATYTIPQSIIRQRDDDAADIYTNSMVTSNSDGLIQFFGGPAIFDVLIQDGNNGNQGSIIDLACGAVEGISTGAVSVFGATVTINANVGITGSLVLSGTLLVGQTSTVNGAFGATGWATFGASVTVAGAVGITGTAQFGSTATFNANVGITGTLTGNSATLTGTLTGVSANFSGYVDASRFAAIRGTTLASTDFTLTAGWGATASISAGNLLVGSRDQRGGVSIIPGGAGITDNPIIYVNFKDGTFAGGLAYGFAVRTDTNAPSTAWWCPLVVGTTQAGFRFMGLPVSGVGVGLNWLVMG